MPVVDQVVPVEHSSLAEVSVRVLSRILDASVSVFHWQGEWCLACDACMSDEAEVQSQLSADELEQLTPDFLDPGALEPKTFEHDRFRYALIPFQHRQIKYLAVAKGQPDSDMRLWTRLVEVAHENLRFQLDRDLRPSASPVLASHEESFLEAVIEKLSDMPPSYSLGDVIQALLPTLASRINAQSLAIVPEAKSSREAFVAHGEPVGDLAEWKRIVETCSQTTTSSDVYRRACGVGYSAIHDFVVAPIKMDDTLFGWIVADVDETDDNEELTASTTSLMHASAGLLATYAFADERLQQKEQLLLDVVRSLVTAIDAKDPQTCGHSVRVAIYASLVADAMGLSKNECDELYLAGLLHDVGKIGIPESILQKDSSLTEQEFGLVKQHSDHGWKILHRLEDLQHILPGVVHHHESFDGTGYPDQIAGDEIPLAARILAGVDAYDALTSQRNYRNGKSHAEAMKVLAEGAGVQWDPEVIEAIHEKAKSFQRVSRKYRHEAYPWRIPGSIEPQIDDSPEPSSAGVTSRFDAWGVDRI